MAKSHTTGSRIYAPSEITGKIYGGEDFGGEINVYHSRRHGQKTFSKNLKTSHKPSHAKLKCTHQKGAGSVGGGGGADWSYGRAHFQIGPSMEQSRLGCESKFKFTVVTTAWNSGNRPLHHIS